MTMSIFIILGCLALIAVSAEYKEEMGTFAWSQWIITCGLMLYMILSWIM